MKTADFYLSVCRIVSIGALFHFITSDLLLKCFFFFFKFQTAPGKRLFVYDANERRCDWLMEMKDVCLVCDWLSPDRPGQ